MKINTVKGTRDYLPREAELRDFIQRQILETYRNSGFNQIITPVIEDIDNLNNSDGGDNLNLMFEVLKRGNKLNSAIANQQFNSLSDIGLRYDLTVPLSRYYANNKSKLLMPMKCIQIGNAYRAENPQKGRYREFTQCDIDIVGINSYWVEVELIVTTATALMNIGVRDFRVRINDRQILKQLFLKFGFSETQIPTLCIIFDKMDKIGVDGVERELSDKKFDTLACGGLLKYIRNNDFSMDEYIRMIGASEYTESIEKIIQSVNQLSASQYRCEFDITLVRGQGYYTGAVFEIESMAYSGSLAGGGRYDNLIGKFNDESIPAVGFSIGFERIFDLLLEQEYMIPGSRKKIAVFFEDDYLGAYQLAGELRSEYDVSIFEKPQKLGKFLNKLQSDGYWGFCKTEQPSEITVLN